MNYLAHLFLSGKDESLIIGNLITDMISKAEERTLSADVLRGVKLHRKIDELTDSHPVFIDHKRSLYPHFRKYSPVVLDIIYDYLLESNWSVFSDEPFEIFEKRIYSLLVQDRSLAEVPPSVRGTVIGMTNDRWLRHYTSLQGLDKVFNRLENKIRFNQSFKDVTHVLRLNEEEWVLDHRSFFSEITRQLQAEVLISPQNGTKY